MTECCVSEQLDAIETTVMSGLKDFQKATVERIDQLYRNGRRRILVSDEVGLGKTLIARGAVAKMAQLRKEEHDDLVKVVYVCSNSAIADQNLQKLRITSEATMESASSSRLSMQHLNVFKQENDPKLLRSYIQLIPITPDTSFRMTRGTGTVSERALMFTVLSMIDYYDKDSIKKLDRILKGRVKSDDSWNGRKESYQKEVKEVNNCNENSKEKKSAHTQNGRDSYLDYMKKKLKEGIDRSNQKSQAEEGTAACLLTPDAIKNCQEEEYSQVIGKFRSIFAQISIDKLEPDFVIMDEFQRFKYLLNFDTETQMGMLANKFFHAQNVRMLLLSATPYKMYSTPEEIDESNIDEHYREFWDVMRFLNSGIERTSDSASPEEGNNLPREAADTAKFEDVWNSYSVKLKELTDGDVSVISATQQLSEEKKKAEDAMYQSVCRTERISEKKNSDIINASDVHMPLEILEQDIGSYLEAQKLIDEIGCSYHVPVDYVKSSPYLLSFMRDYKLKRDIEKYFKEHKNELRKVESELLWLDPNSLAEFKKIPNNNARLAHVMNMVMKCGSKSDGAEMLLWLPPSRPYYEQQGVFKGSEFSSKTLIFSSWEMVPRMLSCLISYEVERRTIGVLEKRNKEEVQYFYDEKEKRYPAAKLNFTMKNGTPGGMSLFTLLYPSEFLANCYDPVKCMNQGLDLQAIRSSIRKHIANGLQLLPNNENARSDRNWYWLAPLLLDKPEFAENWFKPQDSFTSHEDTTDEELSGEDDAISQSKGFAAHMKKFQAYFDVLARNNNDNELKLGRQPDDLADVLTDMSIASPAVCIFRTYRRYEKDDGHMSAHLASRFAKVFINRMNTPESTAAIMMSTSAKNSDEAFWRNVLSYCVDGNIQAVLDEYAHLLTNGMDHDETLLKYLNQQISESINFRTTPYSVDTRDKFRSRMRETKTEAKPMNMRSHYATAFTKGDGKESDADRKKALRNAFNSPFRPFVLASTSVGQEGLDFHNYCRRIVHWNLPSNPIDLEQREGRINRFECLAIRQNVAQRYGYGSIQFENDIWKEMFDKAAKEEKGQGSSDLIPYWGLSEKPDMIKIERIVPMYPFSKDISAYERLIKILSLYRLTLGQARQEELLEYIFQHCEQPDALKELFINLSPFYKNQNKEQQEKEQ